MLLQILLLIVGLALVVKGADFLVDGATDVARRFHVNEFVIGLTIVGFGTSAPELVVSVTGAVNGLSDVAIGNVLGSNTFNILCVLGVTALVAPVPIQRKNRRFDLPVLIGVTVLLILLGLSHSLFGWGDRDEISRLDGALLMVVFAVYIFMCFRNGSDKTVAENSDTAATEKTRKMAVSVIMCIGGLAGLVFGGDMFVDSATQIARMAGLSEKFIAITILAVGTSLPELVTSVVSACKGKVQMALGNVMGSSVFNIVMVLGVSALINPVQMGNIDSVDIVALLGSTLLILISCLTQRDNTVSRYDGLMLLVGEIAYMAWLIARL